MILRARHTSVDATLRAFAALASRTTEASAIVLALASFVFLSVRVLPGDPAALILGDQASASELSALRARLHFDEPLYVQYGRFLRGLVSLDLGDSLRRPGLPAFARVGQALAPTSALAGLAVALGSGLGVSMALLAVGPWLGARRVWVEHILVIVAAMPLLAFAPLLTYVLAARARVLPLPGDPDAGFLGLAFASTLLAIPLSAQVARIGKAALDDVVRAQFLTVVRAKGGAPRRVFWMHALPAASGPIVTVVATQLGALLGGAVVLERLFERAGLGTLILEAYASRDVPVLEGAIVASGALFVAIQAFAAMVHAAIDPRARA
jgi:ABC-type dipeptide/oligopeptide/nickel transport system permease component